MKVAAVQFAPVFRDPDKNTQDVVDILARLGDDGVRLAVFPEAFLTGYCFESKEEAHASALEQDSSQMSAIEESCAENDIFAVVGYAERVGESVCNAARVIGPTGALGNYRKTHLPFLGLDRFADPGNELPIFEVDEARVGVLICYDVRIPEASRCYALAGADILCVATNWPETAEMSSDIVCPTRAMENHVFVIAADRVGEERGYRFVGRSKIIDPLGRVLASADHADEAIVIAEIDPTAARDKNIVKQAGAYELPLFESRRPELYDRISRK